MNRSIMQGTLMIKRTEDGTTLTWTEQGAYLDGFDWEDAPRLRQGGTNELLDSLAKYPA